MIKAHFLDGQKAGSVININSAMPTIRVLPVLEQEFGFPRELHAEPISYNLLSVKDGEAWYATERYADTIIDAFMSANAFPGVADALLDVIQQACQTNDGDLDSMATTAYADAMRLLAKLGRIEILSEHGRRVIARMK